jgi:hypothetical protein
MRKVVSGLGLLLAVWAAGCIYDTTRATPDVAALDRPADAPADRAPDADRGLADQQGIERPRLDKRQAEQSKDLPRDAKAGDKSTPDTKPAADKKAPDTQPLDMATCTGDSSCPGAACATGICAGGHCGLKFVNWGTVCRQSTDGDQCDPAETCDGSSADCPTDVKLGSVTNTPFATSWGYEGFITQLITGGWSSGSQYVEAGEVAGGESRGFVAFDTSSLAGKKILDAELSACTVSASGPAQATLYTVDVSLPYPFDSGDRSQTFGSPTTNLGILLPNVAVGNSTTVSVPAGTVNTGGKSQYSLRMPLGSYRRWSTTGTTGTGTSCDGVAWQLLVHHCGP